MARTLAWASVSAVMALLAFSPNAYASCTARVTVVSASLDRATAIGAWQARVANTSNDLYSDWSYARSKYMLPRGGRLMVSGIPCNSR